MITAEVAVRQTPLETVHKNELIPALNPVTCEEELVVEKIFPAPVITVQSPVPTVGVVAVKVAVAAQML